MVTAKRFREEAGVATGTKKAKAEPVEDDTSVFAKAMEAADYVKQVLEKAPDGLTTRQLQATEQFTNKEIADAINALLKSDGVELAKKGTQMLIRAVTGRDQAAKKGMTQDERSVYNMIRDAGNKGVWTRDIRFACQIQTPVLTKLLKVMETKRLVKSVKSVLQSKKKVYMLYELDPDPSLTGGAWYSEQSFDVELVTLLSQKVSKYITDKAAKALKTYSEDPLKQREHEYVSSAEVHEHVKNSRVFLVDFTPAEIEQITHALELDGKLEAVVAPLPFKVSSHSQSTASLAKEGTKLYRARREAGRIPLYLETPRGATPAFEDGWSGGRRHMLLMAQALV